MVGGTFHSVAHQLLRMHPASVGLPPQFGVLDASDAANILDVLREEHGLAEQKARFPRKATLLDMYSRCVNAQRPLSEVLAETSRSGRSKAKSWRVSSVPTGLASVGAGEEEPSY